VLRTKFPEFTGVDLLKPEYQERVAYCCLYRRRYPIRPGGVQLEEESLNEADPECLICHRAHPSEEE
jgi:hypothetical protein